MSCAKEKQNFEEMGKYSRRDDWASVCKGRYLNDIGGI